MQPNQNDRVDGNRLRFVFDNAVVFCSLASGTTFEDIAWTLGELAPLQFGDPVAIALTLGVQDEEPVRPISVRRQRHP